MSNVPQDVIDEWMGDFDVVLSIPAHKALERILRQAARAQRSNAEPVGEMVELQVGHDDYAVEVKLFETLPAGTKLYTAPPDYDAGVAAGLRLAAEIVKARRIKCGPDYPPYDCGFNYGLIEAREEILSAIPADSKAALRERDLKIAFLFYCVGLGDDGVPSLSMWNEEAATEILNSVLDGKS